MSIFEYDDERQARLFRKEGFEDGFKEGFKKGYEESLKYGKLRMMAEMISRTMKEKGISFFQASKLYPLSDEEIAACKEFMDQMNSEMSDDQDL